MRPSLLEIELKSCSKLVPTLVKFRLSPPLCNYGKAWSLWLAGKPPWFKVGWKTFRLREACLELEILSNIESRLSTLSPLWENYAARAFVSTALSKNESVPLSSSNSSWVVKLSPSLRTNILCLVLSNDIDESDSMRNFLILEIRSSCLVTESWAIL